MVAVVHAKGVETEQRELEHRLAVVCGEVNAAHGRLVDLVAEAIDTEAWHGFGIRSVEHWVAWKTGLPTARARQIVAFARRRTELPETIGALRRGELAVDQAVSVAAYVPSHEDAVGCALAKNTTVSQLRHVLRRYRRAGEPTGEPDRDAVVTGIAGETSLPRVPDRAMFHWDDHDRFRVVVDADSDAGAVIEQALRDAHDALFRAGRVEVTWFDAFSEVCRRSLDSPMSSGRRDRYRIYVHVDTDRAWLNAGARLPEPVMRRLLCDGVVRPVWSTGGVPVNVGRSQRVVPAHTRRLVLDRDRQCRRPGCGSDLHLEVHHIVHWIDGGETDTNHLVALCPWCHDAHHRGEVTIAGSADEPDGLVFARPDGRFINAGAGPIAPDHPPRAPEGRWRHPDGGRIDSKWVSLDPPPLRPLARASGP